MTKLPLFFWKNHPRNHVAWKRNILYLFYPENCNERWHKCKRQQEKFR